MHGQVSTNYSEIPDSSPLVFIDSGIGGLPYLEWVRRHLPGENYVYWADRENFPYGSKAPEEVVQAVSSGVARLMDRFKPKLIVLACNTASVVALAQLRQSFPSLPIVGTVPAVKPAARASRTKKIGVWATERTIKDVYLDELIEKHAAHCEVVRVAGPEIVDLVERRFFQSRPEERDQVVAGSADIFRRRGVDQVVVACTHFLYVTANLRRLLGNGVGILDSRAGVGRRVLALLEGKVAPSKKGGGWMYLSGSWESEQRYRDFASRFNLEMAGSL